MKLPLADNVSRLIVLALLPGQPPGGGVFSGFSFIFILTASSLYACASRCQDHHNSLPATTLPCVNNADSAFMTGCGGQTAVVTLFPVNPDYSSAHFPKPPINPVLSAQSVVSVRRFHSLLQSELHPDEKSVKIGISRSLTLFR
jgi:hypothetical protein